MQLPGPSMQPRQPCAPPLPSLLTASLARLCPSGQRAQRRSAGGWQQGVHVVGGGGQGTCTAGRRRLAVQQPASHTWRDLHASGRQGGLPLIESGGELVEVGQRYALQKGAALEAPQERVVVRSRRRSGARSGREQLGQWVDPCPVLPARSRCRAFEVWPGWLRKGAFIGMTRSRGVAALHCRHVQSAAGGTQQWARRAHARRQHVARAAACQCSGHHPALRTRIAGDAVSVPAQLGAPQGGGRGGALQGREQGGGRSGWLSGHER